MSALVLAVSLFASQAPAQDLYTWTDAAGVTHVTDNSASVPRGTRARLTAGTEISTVTGSAPSKPLTVAAAVTKPAAGPLAPERDLERQWREAFRESRDRIAGLEDQIELDRKKVEDVNGLPVAARFSCFNAWGPVYAPAWGHVAMLSPGGSSVVFSGSSQSGSGFGVAGNVVVSPVIQQQVVVANSGIAVSPCVFAFNPEYERAKERLALNRKALARAQEDADDLDRRASFEAVPREWRR
jgi:hypothetical protein